PIRERDEPQRIGSYDSIQARLAQDLSPILPSGRTAAPIPLCTLMAPCILEGEGGRGSFMPRGWPRNTRGGLRIVIIILAGFLIWQLSDGYRLAWERWPSLPMRVGSTCSPLCVKGCLGQS